MQTRLPTLQEIKALVSFLPQLYAEGFSPIKQWQGGNQKQDRVFTLPWSEYEPVVEEFFKVAASECWCNYNYDLKEAGEMLMNPDMVKTASLPQIKIMLTYCVRGERFCSGHWAAMITDGYIRQLLERLAEIKSLGIHLST